MCHRNRYPIYGDFGGACQHPAENYNGEPTGDAGLFIIRLGILLSIPFWGAIIWGIITIYKEVTGHGR